MTPTDTQITQALLPRSPLPSVYAVIVEFRISYQRARRCLVAAGWVEAEPVKKEYSMEDF